MTNSDIAACVLSPHMHLWCACMTILAFVTARYVLFDRITLSAPQRIFDVVLSMVCFAVACYAALVP